MKEFSKGTAKIIFTGTSTPKAVGYIPLEGLMTKIPASKMDAVDAQQEEDIKSARNLAVGALLACVTISIVNFGAFIFAMYEMGEAIRVLEKAIGK